MRSRPTTRWTDEYETELNKILQRRTEGTEGGDKPPATQVPLTALDHLNRIAYALAAINRNLDRIAEAAEDKATATDDLDPLDDGNSYGRGL